MCLLGSSLVVWNLYARLGIRPSQTRTHNVQQIGVRLASAMYAQLSSIRASYPQMTDRPQPDGHSGLGLMVTAHNGKQVMPTGS